MKELKAECHVTHSKREFDLSFLKKGDNTSSSSSSLSSASHLLGNFLRFLFDVEQFVFYVAVDSEDRFFFLFLFV